jgi:hypothetical protein
MASMGGKAILYGIKVARLALIYVAAAIAVRVQEARYVEEVYGRGAPPPSLVNFLFTLVAFMLVFDALLLSGIKALGAMGVKEFSKSKFVMYVQSESFVYTLFVLGAGLYLSRIVALKRYINYKEDGMRALRALREMLMAVVVPISVTPVFFVT